MWPAVSQRPVLCQLAIHPDCLCTDFFGLARCHGLEFGRKPRLPHPFLISASHGVSLTSTTLLYFVQQCLLSHRTTAVKLSSASITHE